MAYTRSDLVPGGGSLGELRIVQPVLMGEASWRGRVGVRATLNFEGVTLPDGELSPGAWGEGFVDRRHPHTYIHELVVTAIDPVGRVDGVRTSVAAGKGFVPFGTDDPMTRPALRYPVNHHLAQILERAIVVAAARTRHVGFEAALFNGDEPERPGQWPRLARFGDSWSARLSARPIAALEAQVSHAAVRSPEHRGGAGIDQRKWSASARFDGQVGSDPVYGLVEWARTSEAEGFFVFRSLLAEGAWTTGPHRLHYRFEWTERPEEARTADPFRSVRPHLENAILGVTRWTVHTAGYTFEGQALGPLTVAPLVEVSAGRVRSSAPGVLDPARFYEGSSFWAFTAGVRLRWGEPMHRMGRYGAGAFPPASALHAPGSEEHHDPS